MNYEQKNFLFFFFRKFVVYELIIKKADRKSYEKFSNKTKVYDYAIQNTTKL